MACVGMGHAQTYVGGSFGISHSQIKNGNSDQSGTSFKVMPEIGYQLDDNWALGLTVGFTKGYAALGSFDPADIKAMTSAILSTAVDVASDDNIGLDLKGFHLAPYARYTCLKSQGFEVFLEGVVAMNYIKTKTGGADEDTRSISSMALSVDDKLTGFEVCLRPGIAYALSDNFKLTAKIGSLGFQHYKADKADITLSRFGLDMDGNNILFGMQYAF